MKKRVLVIENDPDILEIVELVLHEGGYQVIGVSGQEAGQLSVYQADLIILDDWTDKSNGNSFCGALSNPALSDTPVLMMSTSPNIEEVAKACHAEHYLRKPFDIEELLKKVRCMC